MPLRVLIVEDESSLTFGYIEYIRLRTHAELSSAETAEEATELLTHSPFDLIILDWWLPLGGGQRVLDSLIEQKKNTPCIIASGIVDNIPKKYLSLPQVACVLNKPFSLQALADAVLQHGPQASEGR